MADVADFIGDVQRYDPGASEETVGKIVKHLGIALQRNNAGGLTDSGLVAATDQTELNRVRDKWGVAKLGLDEPSTISPLNMQANSATFKAPGFEHLWSRHQYRWRGHLQI
jgi:hypothetical protein